MSKKWFVLLVTVLGLIAIAPAYAHHGSAAYDASKTVTVTGTVTAFEFVNPHVMISMDVKNASGSIEKWEGEMTSPNHLGRTGWTRNTIKVGDQVTLTGAPAKSGTTTMIIHKVLKNGQEIQLTTE
jgi:polyisoprenoid-binding protein YceI